LREVPQALKVLTVIAKYGEIRGRLALHKLIYELLRSKSLSLDYSFVNFSFGPYSRDLDNDISLLKELKLIDVEELNGYTVFRVSSKGLKVINNLQQLISH